MLDVQPQAMVVNVEKRCGSKNVPQVQINPQVTGMARANMSVVRLQSGDPLVFGRCGEEMAALREAGIPFEAVAGMTSALSAAAAANVSLTYRLHASRVSFSSGHREEPNDHLERDDYETRAVYMPGKNYTKIVADRLEQGCSSDIPCVLVSCASRREQTITRSTLAQLPFIQDIKTPSILLSGRALSDDDLERKTGSDQLSVLKQQVSLNCKTNMAH